MTKGKPMTTRDEFEAYLGDGASRDDFKTFSDGEYLDPATQADWELWQAATQKVEQSRQDLDRRTLETLKYCRDWLPGISVPHQEAQEVIEELSALLGLEKEQG